MLTFSIVCWIHFANILFGVFATLFVTETGLLFSFFVTLLSEFNTEVVWPYKIKIFFFDSYAHFT